MLPAWLQEALDAAADEVPGPVLHRAVTQLVQQYRDGVATMVRGRAERRLDALAYAVSRLPSTYAAVAKVLEGLSRLQPDFYPQSLIDVGAGPGTAVWAALEQYADIHTVWAVEPHPRMRELAQTLLQAAPYTAPVHFQSTYADGAQWPGADLSVASYVFGELSATATVKVLERLWNATAGVLVVIEPGTPRGFQRILQCRAQLLKWQAHIVAPCPHADECPMQDHDWCHFRVRVARSRRQRVAKDGQAPFEDEKFSYLIVSRHRGVLPEGRVVRHPQIRAGHVQLMVCASEGLRAITVAKSAGARYRMARKLQWGDPVTHDLLDLTKRT